MDDAIDKALKQRDDLKLNHWLAINVLGWRCLDDTEQNEPIQQGDFWSACGSQIGTHTGPRVYLDFCNSLDDARQLEDRLRELGMEEEYTDELARVRGAKQQSGVGLRGSDLVFADARQRCEAIRRTWTNNKKGG